jgi:hypothetical protein
VFSGVSEEEEIAGVGTEVHGIAAETDIKSAAAFVASCACFWRGGGGWFYRGGAEEEARCWLALRVLERRDCLELSPLVSLTSVSPCAEKDFEAREVHWRVGIGVERAGRCGKSLTCWSW